MKRSVKALITGVVGAALASTLLVAPSTSAAALSPTAGLPIVEPTRTYDFDGSVHPDWSDRDFIGFTAGGRNCSAPYADQHFATTWNLTLKVNKEPNPAVVAAQKAACVKSLKSKKMSKSTKTLGKKFDKLTPIYRNAMLSTFGAFTMKTGTVAARVKFPSVRGMHGGIWLQSTGGSEIDFIESYGYGKAITSVVHTRYSTGATKEHKLYSKKMKKSWFNKYHVFAVTWDTTKVTFRIDGKVIKTKKITTSGDYFLVMSLLSSDWELSKLKNSSLKKSSSQMTVDWIKAWATS